MECHTLTNKSTIYNEVVNIDFYTLVRIGNNDEEVQVKTQLATKSIVFVPIKNHHLVPSHLWLSIGPNCCCPLSWHWVKLLEPGNQICKMSPIPQIYPCKKSGQMWALLIVVKADFRVISALIIWHSLTLPKTSLSYWEVSQGSPGLYCRNRRTWHPFPGCCLEPSKTPRVRLKPELNTFIFLQSHLYWLCGEGRSKLASSASCSKVEPSRIFSSFLWLAGVLPLPRPNLAQNLPISMSYK